MNSGIVSQIQKSPVETLLEPSISKAGYQTICTDGSCESAQNDEFFALLDVELKALSDTESSEIIFLSDLDNLNQVTDLNDNSIIEAEFISMLSELEIELEGKPEIEVNSLIQHALEDLPSKIDALPLTPESKVLLQQSLNIKIVNLGSSQINLANFKQGVEVPQSGNVLPLETQVINNSLSLENHSTDPQSNKQEPIENNNSHNLLKDEGEFEWFKAESDLSIQKQELSSKPSVEKLNISTIKSEGSISKLNDSLSVVLNQNQVLPQPSTQTTGSSLALNNATLQLPQNPSPDQWGNALGEKIQLMINTKMESAELRIDPPHLGKMDVKIQINEDSTKVIIQTQHTATRELVDAASYRLKDWLQESGFQNVDVDVSQQQQSQENPFSEKAPSEESLNASLEQENLSEIETGNVISGNVALSIGNLDLFA